MNIIARLTRDAQVHTLSNEQQVVNFSVAINDGYQNKQGERTEQVTYLDCAYWRTAKVAQYLTKGKLVELTGRVSARAWVDNAIQFYAHRLEAGDEAFIKGMQKMMDDAKNS